MTESSNISLVAAGVYLQLLAKIYELQNARCHPYDFGTEIENLNTQAANIETANVKQWASLALQAQRLNQALIEAKEVIKTWHELRGLKYSLGPEGEEQAWRAYQESPEMKSINAVLRLFEQSEAGS